MKTKTSPTTKTETAYPVSQRQQIKARRLARRMNRAPDSVNHAAALIVSVLSSFGGRITHFSPAQ